MNFLKILNIFIFQFLFIRITRCQEKRIVNFHLESVSLMSYYSHSMSGSGRVKTYQWYAVQYWILPFTGWFNDFIYISKKSNFLKLTKEKEFYEF